MLTHIRAVARPRNAGRHCEQQCELCLGIIMDAWGLGWPMIGAPHRSYRDRWFQNRGGDG
jgi:hypothetical protein